MLGNRGSAIALIVAGVLAFIGSGVTWVTCSTTPCGGSLMTISTYSGLTLGYGVLAAMAGALMVIIGVESLRRTALMSAMPALVLGALVVASILIGVVDVYVDPDRSLMYTILVPATGGLLSLITGARLVDQT